MTVIDWLLDADPAIRWQVMRDLTHEPADVVAAERARVATEGWGARLLALQAPDGLWAGNAFSQDRTDTFHVLELLRRLGLDPASEQARRAIGLVREHVTWGDGAWWNPPWADSRFFEGEVEPCINGNVVATGSYFGVDMTPLVDRLLGEQLADGGWNCEVENGATVSSFGTTINVLEGLLEHERAIGGSARVGEARRRGEEYMLERRLFRRKSTGEVIDPDWLRFSFPTWWHYDVLRGLDYLRDAGVDARRARRRGDRGRRGQAGSRRPVAAPERPRGQGPLPDGGRRGQAEPLEHAPRAARARLVRARPVGRRHRRSRRRAPREGLIRASRTRPGPRSAFARRCELMAFRMTATADTTTTTQISQGNLTARSGTRKPAADRTATVSNAIRIAWATAATRIRGGNRPGTAPPIA